MSRPLERSSPRRAAPAGEKPTGQLRGGRSRLGGGRASPLSPSSALARRRSFRGECAPKSFARRLIAGEGRLLQLALAAAPARESS